MNDLWSSDTLPDGQGASATIRNDTQGKTPPRDSLTAIPDLLRESCCHGLLALRMALGCNQQSTSYVAPGANIPAAAVPPGVSPAAPASQAPVTVANSAQYEANKQQYKQSLARMKSLNTKEKDKDGREALKQAIAGLEERLASEGGETAGATSKKK